MSTAAATSTPAIPDNQWREVCSQLRATDDISFKLLGFVPLLTVAAISAVLLKSEAKFSIALVLACFVGSLSVLGFWIWERRNIQTCLWLRNRAAALEQNAFGPEYVGQFSRFPAAPYGLGKTQAERLVYGTTLVAWLLVPLTSLSPSDTIAHRALEFSLYALGSIVIILLGWRQISVAIEVAPREA